MLQRTASDAPWPPCTHFNESYLCINPSTPPPPTAPDPSSARRCQCAALRKNPSDEIAICLCRPSIGPPPPPHRPIDR